MSLVCNYLGKPYPLNELKNPVTFDGASYTPHFSIYKNGSRITRNCNGVKSKDFTYNQVMAYNTLVNGEIVFVGLFLDKEFIQ